MDQELKDKILEAVDFYNLYKSECYTKMMRSIAESIKSHASTIDAGDVETLAKQAADLVIEQEADDYRRHNYGKRDGFAEEILIAADLI